MNDADTMIFTYILRTIKGELYCGKSSHMETRMNQHRNRKDVWFSINNRHQFKILCVIKGDFEKTIKRCGVARFIDMINNIDPEVSAS